MIQLGVLAIGALAEPIATAFRDDEHAFWLASQKQHASITVEIGTKTGLREQVRAALEFLDQNSQAASLLPDLLLARPGNPQLRDAIGQALPDALSAVSEARFELERLIATALSSAEARMLHANLARIDALAVAVTAYKEVHDLLHVLHPTLALMRRTAADRTRWAELTIYVTIFRQNLLLIDAAGAKLAGAGFTGRIDFRDKIDRALTTLARAIAAAAEYDIADTVSELAALLEQALDSIDSAMRATVRDANQPFQQALGFFQPLAVQAVGSRLEPLFASYLAFAQEVAAELERAIDEHTSWQLLHRQFDMLQRRIVFNEPSAAGEIDSLWRTTVKALNQLCADSPPPPWAVAIVELVGLAAADLTPPVTPPVKDIARERVNVLISNGRDRFTAVDKSLLDWMKKTLGRRPELISLLGEDAR